MKRHFLNLIKRVNHLTNEQFAPNEEAEIILKYLLLKSNTQQSIQVFSELEKQFRKEMQKRESEASELCKLVNGKYPKIAHVFTAHDPAFDKPLNQ